MGIEETIVDLVTRCGGDRAACWRVFVRAMNLPLDNVTQETFWEAVGEITAEEIRRDLQDRVEQLQRHVQDVEALRHGLHIMGLMFPRGPVGAAH